MYFSWDHAAIYVWPYELFVLPNNSRMAEWVFTEFGRMLCHSGYFKLVVFRCSLLSIVSKEHLVDLLCLSVGILAKEILLPSIGRFTNYAICHVITWEWVIKFSLKNGYRVMHVKWDSSTWQTPVNDAVKQKEEEGGENENIHTAVRRSLKQFTKTSIHYWLFLKINISCVKKK
jgi:hypothetical protein